MIGSALMGEFFFPPAVQDVEINDVPSSNLPIDPVEQNGLRYDPTLQTPNIGAPGSQMPDLTGFGPLVATAYEAKKMSESLRKAKEVIEYAKNHNGATQHGYKGGSVFVNDGRDNSEILPTEDADGNPITYREYDVNPNEKFVDRGTERVVMGSDGKNYYTKDHYKSFSEVK